MATGFLLSLSSFQRKLESRKAQPGCLNGCWPWNAALSRHSRWHGNVMINPLDSGLRRNDGAFMLSAGPLLAVL